jgi:hypothetical protein
MIPAQKLINYAAKRRINSRQDAARAVEQMRVVADAAAAPPARPAECPRIQGITLLGPGSGAQMTGLGIGPGAGLETEDVVIKGLGVGVHNEGYFKAGPGTRIE